MREEPPGLPHYCAVLNHATVTGSQKFGIFVYNAEALEEPLLARLSVMRLSEKARLPLAELRQA